MTELQKIIKYIAMALAIVLAVSIVAGIVGSFMRLSFVMDILAPNNSDADKGASLIVSDEDLLSVSKLHIELAAAELTIAVGNELSVVSDKSFIEVSLNDGVLMIREQEHGFFEKAASVTMTVPQDLVFDKADIESGAAVIKAECLLAQHLSLSVGAGEARFAYLEATSDADIETGAGKLAVESGIMKDLDMAIGVGKAQVETSLIGSNSIETGVGALELTLIGPENEYAVTAITGLGSFTVDGTLIREDTTLGSGDTRVTVEGGVGSVTVDFAA